MRSDDVIGSMARSPLTRRQLLRRLGMVGGTSVMMTAMRAWDLMGQPAGPRPQLRGNPGDAQVLILGGGISGLIVGYELGRLGYDYRILEARDRVGGLCWTVRRGDSHTEIGGERQLCEFDEGQYFNAGAWRIPNADSGILGYCKELGVPLEIFVDATDANYFYSEDPSLGELAGRRVRLREVKADIWGSVSELLAKAMDRGDIDVPLSEEDQDLLLQFLVRAGYLGSEDHVYQPPEIRGSEGRYDFSSLLRSTFWTRASSVYQGIGGPEPVFQPVGGMMQIPIAFERVVGDRITFEAEVLSIRQTEDEVTVTYRNPRTGEESQETAAYCVCCLPMSILKTIDVDLSGEMAGAVELSEHSNSAKMGLQMARRFWEEDDGIFGGHLWHQDLEIGEFSYPSNDYFTEKGVLLGFYTGGDVAGLDQRPVRDRVEFVLSQASKVHPQITEEFESAYAVWWDKVPYSLGAYARSPTPERLEQLSRPDGRIFMGSAGASQRPAWIEGAVEAAWRTVEAVHERAMRDAGG